MEKSRDSLWYEVNTKQIKFMLQFTGAEWRE